MKSRGVFFGLNYPYHPKSKLQGCINDAHNMAAFLGSKLNMQTDVYSDDRNIDNTTGKGIIRRLYELAVASYREDLDLAWIHYSGHGTHIKDTSGDELDGTDECLVPSDYKECGLLTDDYINAIFQSFNPKTRVVCIFDCCHSGTIGDLKYSWEGESKAQIENINCDVSARTITISGCMDNQISMDVQNMSNDNKFSGALTTTLLRILCEDFDNTTQNVFTLLTKLREYLKQYQFEQVPILCSSYNLAKDILFIPK